MHIKPSQIRLQSVKLFSLLLLLQVWTAYQLNAGTNKTGPVSAYVNTTSTGCTVRGTRNSGWKLNKDAKCSASGCTNASVTTNTDVTGEANGTLASASTAFTLMVKGTASPVNGSGGGTSTKWSVTLSNKNYFVDPPEQIIGHDGSNGRLDAFSVNGAVTSPEASKWRVRIKDGSWGNWTGNSSTMSFSSSTAPGEYQVQGQDYDDTNNEDIVNVDVYDIQIKSGTKTITRDTAEADRFLYISGTPAMPEIKVELLGGDKSASASISIDYTLRYRTMTTTGTASGTTSKSEAWDVDLGKIRGGTAVASASVDGVKLLDIEFYIRANNPTAVQVKTYLQSKSAPWYAFAIANHETGCKQMNTPTSGNVGVDTTTKVGGTPNEAAIQDGGVGLFQITNPAPTADSVWDWKKNTDQGLQIIANKSAQELPKYNSAKNQTSVPIPTQTIGGVVFKDGTLGTNEKPVFDAFVIKAYNGLASWNDDTNAYGGIHSYAEWNTSTSSWKLYPNNAYYNNQTQTWIKNEYIEKVCLAK